MSEVVEPQLPIDQPTTTANVVAAYKDGVGNLINAIQYNGDPGTITNMLAWSKRIHKNAKGRITVQNDHLMQGVGVNDWCVMDSRRVDQVFVSTNPQFRATYQLPTGGPIP